MFFFKKVNTDGTLDSLQSSSNYVSEKDSGLICISQTEFDELSAEMSMKAEEEERLANEAMIEEQMRIENLEKENAALLFQILTGEEYADV